MSVRVMSWVFTNSVATGNDRLVLLAIADRCDDDGTDAWPSLATIAKKAHVSRRTVIRAIQSLEDLGELSVDRSTGGHSTNSYRVVMETAGGDKLAPLGGDNLSPCQVDTGDTGVTAEVTLLSPNTSLRPSSPLPPKGGYLDHCSKHGHFRRDCDRCVDARAARIAARDEERERLRVLAADCIDCEGTNKVLGPDKRPTKQRCLHRRSA